MATHPHGPAGRSYIAATLTILLILVPALVCAQTSTIEHTQRLDGDSTGRTAAPSGWKGAFRDSIRLLTIEHATRIAFQNKTRRELGAMYYRSARALSMTRAAP